MAGTLDATGLTIPTVVELLEEIAQEQRATVDPNLITEVDEPLGQLSGIFVSHLREAYEVVEVAYGGMNPDDAESFLLEGLSQVSGTVRRKATRSIVTTTCNVDLDTTLDAIDTVAHVTDQPETRFRLQTTFTSPGDGNYSLVFEAEETGLVVANAGTLEVIATPVSGWNSITNAADADLGRVVDTDPILRARRTEQLQKAGSGTTDAIRSDMLDVEGVVSCTVVENATHLTDTEGRPPSCIEALVFDGVGKDADDDDIAQAIWDNKAGGVFSYGAASDNGDIVDDNGVTHNIKFTRPTLKDIYIDITYSVDPDNIPTEATVKASIVSHMVSINAADKDVFRAEIAYGALIVDGVTNVDLPAIEVGFTAAPTGTVDLVIGSREIADYDTSRITKV